MSRAYGLCRFKKTGNIYACCYNGTVDIMQPRLLTIEQATDEDGYLAVISKIYYSNNCGWEELQRDPPNDLDKIEIYSDYGGGFYWNGIGSESRQVIWEGHEPFDKFEIKHGQPKWVTDFWINFGE